MIQRTILMLIVALAALALPVRSQTTEITISLSEQFFDAVIDAIFRHGEPPHFSIAAADRRGEETELGLTGTQMMVNYANAFIPEARGRNCSETIRLLRENNGVRTAVRFRDGLILSPLSFVGNYDAPLFGCIEFAGWAETNIELKFDESGQRLVAHARVNKVNLNGTGGVGNTVIARLVQSSIDKRINPIEIFKLDKVSFMLPIQNSLNLRMKATGVRQEVANGILHVHISYEFQKS